MRIGVAKEIKPDEYRVALTPAAHSSWSTTATRCSSSGAPASGSAFADAEYERVGARIVSVDEAWERATSCSRSRSRSRPSTGGFARARALHVPAHRRGRAADARTHRAGITAVAYETVETVTRRLPLLAPMSEVAGRLAAQAGAYYLEKPHGGAGSCSAACPASRPARS